MKNKIIQRSAWLICLFLVIVIRSAAQTDPHFTQNYTYPMYINPALTGSSDGEYRVSSIYRSQWGSISNPYRTMGVSFDTRTNKNIALGVNLLNQSAGDGGFNYLTAYASVAYTGVKFGKDNNHHVVLAMQAGVINRRVDQSKFKWGEQWNPVTGYSAIECNHRNFCKNIFHNPGYRCRCYYIMMRALIKRSMPLVVFRSFTLTNQKIRSLPHKAQN